ncbi:MAG TPA: ABC transporter permease [Mobilitalea sp.]|nr:ABC transporter permease [Mobilitalea sp.]
MRIPNITALFQKQIKDVLKNMPVLVLFIVYPIIAAVMTNAMSDQPEVGTMFLSIFATMHCAFTPIVATSSIIAEEKEKNTLRVLIMSNVTLREYLFSIGGFVLIATLITGSTFLLIQTQSLVKSLLFLASMGIGGLISIALGMCIGLLSKNAAAANGLAVPFGMVFAFLPMLANFNKGIEAVSRFTYGQQVSYLFAGKPFTVFGVVILCINFIALITVSTLLYKRSIAED